MVLPTSRAIEDAWEDIARREEEREAEEDREMEKEPGLKEYPKAEEAAGPEEAQSPHPTIITNLQGTILNDVSLLFSPETRKKIWRAYIPHPS